MSTLENLGQQWQSATTQLPWGVQRSFYESLKLVEEGKIHMAFGSDYNNSDPCLVNTNATMFSATSGEGGTGLPIRHFRDVVGAFDQINQHFHETLGFGEKNSVSADAAGFLVRWFSELKTVEQATVESKEDVRYSKLVSDGELLQDWLNAQTSIPEESVDEVTSES